MGHVDPADSLSLFVLDFLVEPEAFFEVLERLFEFPLLLVVECQVVVQSGTDAYVVGVCSVT